MKEEELAETSQLAKRRRKQSAGPTIGWYIENNALDLSRLELLLKRHTPEFIVFSGRPEDIPTSVRTIPQLNIDDCDILFVLGNTRPAQSSKRSTWMFIPGDPRGDWGDGAVERAVDSNLHCIGMILADVSSIPPKVLAFDTMLRRSRDGAAAMNARLDSCLPTLLADALERLQFDPSSHFEPPRSASRSHCETAHYTASYKESIRDAIKYLIHRIVSSIARGHSDLLTGTHPTRFLALHSPPPDILDELLSALSRVAPFLSLDEVLMSLAVQQQPPRGFVITFDDGNKQNIALLDVLDRHRCRAVFYVSTRSLGTRLPLWFMNPDKSHIQHKEVLRKASYSEFLKLERDLGLTAPDDLRWRFGLGIEELNVIKSRGHQIGIHTVNHPFLPRLTESELSFEILSCFDRLRDVLGSEGLHLDVAYPNGDYDERVVKHLQSIGVRSAVTLNSGNVTASTDVLRIPRFHADDFDYLGYALFKQTGLYRIISQGI